MNIKIGLLFSISLSGGTFGFGQLIAREYPVFYTVGYNVRSESPDISRADLEQAKPVLMGNFFDVLIRNPRWKSIGNFPCPKVPFPCFKIKIGDLFYVESWDRERKREATSDELTVLRPRTDYAPIILENALKAYFGLIQWESLFDPLKIENVIRVSDMC